MRRPPPPSDGEFAALVEASWGSLYRTAYLLVGQRRLAEDLVQDALARTYASWSKVRDVDAAPGYAHRVLVNTASSWFRKRSWREERPTDAVPEDLRAPGQEHDASLRPTVLGALDRLAPRQRAVVVLSFYEDLSVAQTAEALGISPGTVKSQTSDALSRLRDLLGDAVVPVTTGGPHD